MAACAYELSCHNYGQLIADLVISRTKVLTELGLIVFKAF